MTDLAHGSATSPSREHDVDWRRAVQDVVWIPEAYREAAVPATAARRSLRCTESSFAQLVDLGLPYEESPQGPLFDAVDLKNVGLYSRSGVTEVEMGMRLMLAFMQSPAEELVRERRWRYRLQLVSSAEAGARIIKKVYRPMPELFGGRLESWTCPDGAVPEVVGPVFRMVQGSEVTGTLVTRGEQRSIRSEAIRHAVEEVLDSGLRWHALPPAFAASPEEATALGVGNCSTLCTVVRDRLRGAGFDARAYHGWMIAVSEVDHGWVEVVDEDGDTKYVDPSFALLSTGNGFGTEQFRALTMGSMLNRVVPTEAPIDESYVLDGDGTDAVAFVGRPAEAPGERQGRRRGVWRRGAS